MNDIDTCCNHLQTNHYAEITALINRQDNDTLNRELQDVSIWLIENKLSPNTEKLNWLSSKNSEMSKKTQEKTWSFLRKL